MQMPPGYDAWRLSPPEDKRTSRFAPSTVEAGFCLDLDEGYVETTCTVDAEYGEIVSVKLGGAQLSPAMVEEIIGKDEYARKCKLIEDELPDLIRAAAEDEYDQWCDWKYEQYRDAYGVIAGKLRIRDEVTNDKWIEEVRS